MIIGYFKEYRGYRGSIEHTPTNMLTQPIHENETNVDFYVKSRYKYYGRILDIGRDNIIYYSNDIIVMHRLFMKLVDNYIAFHDGITQCGGDGECDYFCNYCTNNPVNHNTDVEFEIVPGSHNFYNKKIEY